MIAFGLGSKRLQQIAVVEMEGMIGARMRPSEYVKLFRALGENDRIKAVVLDVDSPGGSASASDLLYLVGPGSGAQEAGRCLHSRHRRFRRLPLQLRRPQDRRHPQRPRRARSA